MILSPGRNRLHPPGVSAFSNRRTKRPRGGSILFPVAPPGAMMSISFQSEEIVLEKLRERLRRMTDEELIRFGKDVRRLAENPFQRQLEEARREWKRRTEATKQVLQ